MNYYIVGKILNTHGLKGELRVSEQSDFDRFYEGSKLYINYKDEYIPVVVESAKDDYKGCLFVTFKNLNDINLVEKYKGSLIYIAEEDQEELPEDLNYLHDIIGKDVYNQNNEYKGVCKEMLEAQAGYVMVVVKDKKRSLVPFIRGVFITKVDEVIHINEIEGLF